MGSYFSWCYVLLFILTSYFSTVLLNVYYYITIYFMYVAIGDAEIAAAPISCVWGYPKGHLWHIKRYQRQGHSYRGCRGSSFTWMLHIESVRPYYRFCSGAQELCLWLSSHFHQNLSHFFAWLVFTPTIAYAVHMPWILFLTKIYILKKYRNLRMHLAERSIW